MANVGIDGKSIEKMQAEVVERTGIPTSGFEISSFFGLEDPLESATLLISGDRVGLVRFSERQLNSDQANVIYEVQESPEDVTFRSFVDVN